MLFNLCFIENLSYSQFIVLTLLIICGIIGAIFIFYYSRKSKEIDYLILLYCHCLTIINNIIFIVEPSPSPTLPPGPAESTGR